MYEKKICYYYTITNQCTDKTLGLLIIITNSFVFYSLQCPFIDVSIEEIDGEQRFNAQLVANALRQLVQSIRHRAGFITVYQSVMECSEPDIRFVGFGLF